jgi:hypothetical protein
MAKKLVVVAVGALILGTTLVAATAASAQGYYYGQYGSYGYAPRAGYGPYYGPAQSDCDRGGPGPRVGCGSGLGIGAER